MRRLVFVTAVSALPLLAACAGGGAAPSRGMLAAGHEVVGTLAEGDARMADQSWYDPYPFSARAGERLRFSMSSSEFDTFLAIGPAGQGEAFEMLASDDDGAGQGTNSQLDFVAPRTGTFEVRANSLGAGETGAYTLSMIRRGMAPPPPPPGSLMVGGEVTGELTGSDGQTAERQAYDDYRFRASAGQRIQAVMRSDAFDTYLEVGEVGDAAFTPIKSDDDGLGEGTNSRLNWVAPADGDYLLRARSFLAEGAGAYQLSLADRGPAPPVPAPTRIQLAERVTGSLGEGDAVNEDDVAYDGYVIAARAGQRLSVTLTAEGFDTVVSLGREGPNGTYSELVVDDDGGPGPLDSRATWVVTEDGDHVIRATAFGTGGGDYALEVVDLGPEPTAQPIQVGQTVNGELVEGDGYANDHSLYDAYVVKAQAGQRLSASLSSAAFDTVLTLGQVGADGAFSVVNQNDDAVGTNSRIGWRVPADGEYVLRASVLGGTGAGPYSLILSDLGPEPAAVPVEIGAVTNGQLSLGDALADDSSLYDAYEFRAAAGQRLQIVMRSGDFDTYLMLGTRSPEGFQAIGTDDDGLAEGTNSRLYFTAPAEGAYEVRANALTPGDTGAYALTIEPRAPDPEAGSVVIGGTVRGSLADGDGVADDNSLFDAYRFQAQPGDRLRFTMTSNQFDTFLMLLRQGQDGLPQVLGTDDDGLSDTNSRLDFDVVEAGEYVIRANSYGAAQKGDYVLTIERRAPGDDVQAPTTSESAVDDHAH